MLFNQVKNNGRLADDRILHLDGLNEKNNKKVIIQKLNLINSIYSISFKIFDSFNGLITSDKAFLNSLSLNLSCKKVP